jgi:hypothetical protein
MHNPYLQLILLILFFSVSCSQKKENVPYQILSLQETTSSKDLKLSDIMTDIKIVPLETNKESLIGAYSKFVIGEKYIICITREKVLQFSSSGQFLRCLTNAGRGPEEFLDIMCYQVDQKERDFYFSEDHDNKIRKINLSTGKFENPIRLPSNAQLEFFSFINEDKIAIFPYHRAKSSFFIFYQDTLSNVLSGIPLERDALTPPMYMSFQPIKWGQKLFYYHSAICGDTVILIDKLKKSPYLIIDGGQKIDILSRDSEGFSTSIFLISSGFCLLNNAQLVKKGGAVNLIGTKYYLANGTERKLYEIKSFINDYSGGIYKGGDLEKLRNFSIDLDRQLISFHINAFDFIKIAKSANFSSLNKEYQKMAQTILRDLEQNDNQVLLIGKVLNKD